MMLTYLIPSVGLVLVLFTSVVRGDGPCRVEFKSNGDTSLTLSVQPMGRSDCGQLTSTQQLYDAMKKADELGASPHRLRRLSSHSKSSQPQFSLTKVVCHFCAGRQYSRTGVPIESEDTQIIARLLKDWMKIGWDMTEQLPAVLKPIKWPTAGNGKGEIHTFKELGYADFFNIPVPQEDFFEVYGDGYILKAWFGGRSASSEEFWRKALQTSPTKLLYQYFDMTKETPMKIVQLDPDNWHIFRSLLQLSLNYLDVKKFEQKFYIHNHIATRKSDFKCEIAAAASKKASAVKPSLPVADRSGSLVSELVVPPYVYPSFSLGSAAPYTSSSGYMSSDESGSNYRSLYDVDEGVTTSYGPKDSAAMRCNYLYQELGPTAAAYPETHFKKQGDRASAAGSPSRLSETRPDSARDPRDLILYNRVTPSKNGGRQPKKLETYHKTHFKEQGDRSSAAGSPSPQSAWESSLKNRPDSARSQNLQEKKKAARPEKK